MRGDQEFQRARAIARRVLSDFEQGNVDRYQPGGLDYVIEITPDLLEEEWFIAVNGFLQQAA